MPHHRRIFALLQTVLCVEPHHLYCRHTAELSERNVYIYVSAHAMWWMELCNTHVIVGTFRMFWSPGERKTNMLHISVTDTLAALPTVITHKEDTSLDLRVLKFLF